MSLSKKGAVDLIQELRRLTPKDQPSAKHVAAAAAKISHVCEIINCDKTARQKIWVAKIHHVLGEWLKALVTDAPKNDPESELLYHVCTAIHALVESSTASDNRAPIGEQVMGSLATLACNQRQHDAEAVQIGLVTFVSLFSNVAAGAESQKILKNKFFGVLPDGSISNDDTAAACRLMLKDPARLLVEARTFNSQMSICDVLVRAPTRHALPPRRASATPL